MKHISGETAPEPEDAFECLYFAVDRGKSPPCLELRLSGGERKALPYAYISEMTLQIESGIEIYTADKCITILGRNLGKLFDYLIIYRIRFIQINPGTDAGEDGLFVKDIRIEDR